jgi:hypothetical protein
VFSNFSRLLTEFYSILYRLPTIRWQRFGTSPDSRRALFVATLAVLLVVAWQAITVHVNYHDNWTGLFRIGSRTKLPPALAQRAFRNASPTGYDGQYYLILAEDPLLRDGAAAYLDEAPMRSRRILIPAMAWALAAGRPAFIAGAYVFVVLAFILAGAYWLARIQMFQGRHPAWGFCFLAMPPVLVAVDSMTVDVAIAALAAGFAWHLITGRVSGLWLILAAAALVRETGLLLVAACVFASIYQREWRKAALWATAALPAFCWYCYLHAVLPGAGAIELIPHHMPGYLLRMLVPIPYTQFSPLLRTMARVLDELALVSTLALAVISIARLRSVRPLAQKAALVLYVVMLFAMTGHYFWYSAYSFGRTLAPVFVLPMTGDRPRLTLTLALLVDLRILAEFQSQAQHILHWPVVAHAFLRAVFTLV